MTYSLGKDTTSMYTYTDTYNTCSRKSDMQMQEICAAELNQQVYRCSQLTIIFDDICR